MSRFPFSRDPAEEVRDEIRFYLEERTRELMEEEGLDEEEARRRAVEAFGDVERIEEELRRQARSRERESRTLAMAGTMLGDVRFALRSLRKRPGFTAVALLTLALGIGATTAIFSVAERALLAEPPVRDPGSLAAVYTTSRRGFPRSSSSWPDYLDYRDRTGAFQDLAATSPLPLSLGDGDAGSRLATGRVVTGNYFTLLGVRPRLGRLIQPADDVRDGARRVSVLSHDLWRTHFGADPTVVGRTIRLNQVAFTVVGVAPEGFRGVSLEPAPDLWVPMFAGPPVAEGFSLSRETIWDERGSRWIDRLVARLAPGATVERARSELLAVSEQLREEDPDARGPRSVTVDPARHYTLPRGSEEAFSRFVVLLAGVVGFTLLLACASLANLLLARASAREREIAVRLSLGAGRGRLLRQLLTESTTLAVAGGLLGLGVARLLLDVLAAFELPGGVTVASLGVEMDGEMFGLALLLSVATGLLFGAVPALQATRPEIVPALKGEAGRRGGDASQRLRKGLVAVQVALCLVLLVGSGLFLRTLGEGFSVDLGMEAEEVALARFNPELVGYGQAETAAFRETLLERVRALPGVEAAAVSSRVPLQSGGARGFFVEVDGYEPGPDEEMRIDLVMVTPGYFESLGVPLLEGRAFGGADGEGSEPVMVVDRTMAERWWPSRSPVGATVRFAGDDRPIRVVGVAGATSWNGLSDEPTPFLFLSMEQVPSFGTGFQTLSVRTAEGADGLLPLLRDELRALEPRLPLTSLQTMDDQRARILMPQRMGAVLLSFFGVLAVVLAVVGIVGVVGYAVSRRAREIGIRMALGARKAEVLRSVAVEMAAPVLLGIAAGFAVSLALTEAVEGFLFRVSPTDPTTFAGIGLLLLGVALAATLVPARRATRVNPVDVLKAE